jgi:hypothetical protein
MNIDIRKPELIGRIEAHMQSRRFGDRDDLNEQAPDALDERRCAR